MNLWRWFTPSLVNSFGAGLLSRLPNPMAWQVHWHVAAVNDLSENCYATPAISDGMIVIRSERSLRAFQNRGR